MKGYIVCVYESIKDDDALKNYAIKARSAVEKYSGKFLIRGGKNIITEGKNCMLSPPFVDAHFHMDATLSLGCPRLNHSGTLLEGIQIWGELKPDLTQEVIKDRALRYCDLAVSCKDFSINL